MATVRDVARRAGVSVATVSFVLNDTKPVTPATRERIEAAMAELGFRRNAMARALASRRTHMVALAYPALEHRLGNTALEFVTGAARKAREEDYHLVLWPVSTDGAELAELIGGGLTDGVLLMEVLLDDPRVPLLQAAGLPFSLIGRTADPTGLDYVDIDFDESLRLAFDHLQGLGHRTIAFVQEGPLDRGFRTYGPKRRSREAFERIARQRQLATEVIECPPTASGGRGAAGRLVERLPDLTAVIVQNDDAAAGVVAGLQAAGVRVPDDASVLSLMTSPEIASMADPMLTILHAPGTQLGALGATRLIDQIEGRQLSEPQLVSCVLVAGQSTGPAPRQQKR